MSRVAALGRELYARSPMLAVTALTHACLAVAFLMLMPLDDRTVLGIDPWIKPTKFAVSIAVYTATVAWLIGMLASPARRRRISAWLAGTMFVEILFISIQSARGVPSHFNQTTPGDGLIFSVMGLAIAVNTGFMVYLFVLLGRGADLAPAYQTRRVFVSGVRLGILLFVAAGIEGGFMSAILRHTVGAADGGPGLPFLNWSTRAGDLRVAHFVGLHALQVVPLVAWLLERSGNSRALAWTRAVAGAYGLGFTGVLVIALAGIPIVP